MNEARWEKLKTFVAERTHQPLGPDDGYSLEDVRAAEQYLGLPFPEALRELYMLIGRRDELVRGFNQLIALENMEWNDTDVTEEGEPYLRIWIENQSSMYLGILLDDLGEPDPVVQWISDMGNIDSNYSKYVVSENALAIVALELTHGSPYGYLLDETDTQREAIQKVAQPHLNPFLAGIGFKQLGDALLMNVGHYLVSASSEQVFKATFEPFGDFTWEHLNDSH